MVLLSPIAATGIMSPLF